MGLARRPLSGGVGLPETDVLQLKIAQLLIPVRLPHHDWLPPPAGDPFNVLYAVSLHCARRLNE